MEQHTNAYSRVAAVLRERILAGLLKVQEKLSTERELSEQFNVSRITIRRALELLEEEHLISRRQGKGTFVNPQPTRRLPLLIDYARSIHTHAPKLKRELLVWRWMPVPDWVADRLKIVPGEEIFYCERLDILDKKAVAWDQAYLVRSFAQALSEQDLVKVEFTEIWSKTCSFPIEYCRQIVDAVPAGAEVAKNLKLSSGDPVLKAIEIFVTLYERPAGLFVNYYHPAYISLVSNFNWTNLQTT